MQNQVDLNKTFQHVFEDPDWISKAIIGALILIVPILNFTVFGYEVRVIRNVSKGEPHPMPAWDDFGAFFTDGLQLGLARIVYGLPALVFLFPFFFIFLLPLLAAIVSGNSDSEAADRVFGLVFGAGLLGAFVSLGIAMIYALVLGVFMPAVTANFSKHGTFASCFDFRTIFGFVRANGNNYLMVWVAGLLAGLVVYGLYFVISFVPCVGFLFALPVALGGGFFVLMVSGHAIGQALAHEVVPGGGSHELPAT